MIALTDVKKTEDLLFGSLAVLALRGVDTLQMTDRSFHERFGKALQLFRDAGGPVAELASSYHKDVVSSTYDELDHALIAAEQLGLVRFPNPTYSRLQIAISPRVAEKLLRGWSQHRELFEKAAEALEVTSE